MDTAVMDAALHYIVYVLLVLFIAYKIVMRVRRMFFKLGGVPKLKGKSPAKTYTFEPTGVRFECKFPSGRTKRQYAISRSRVSDPLELRFYEWEGEPAIMVINKRVGNDIGVARADKDLPKLQELLDRYDYRAMIEDFTQFEYDGETYSSAVVKVYLYDRD